MSPRWRGKVNPESGKEFNILLNTAETAYFVHYYSFKNNMTLTLASLLQKNDLIELWKAFKTHAPFSELTEFAITLLEIVVNQAGCVSGYSQTSKSSKQLVITDSTFQSLRRCPR